jgi:putative two-component system response regulator
MTQAVSPVPPAHASARILLADDMAPNLALLTRIVKRAGYGNVYGTTDAERVFPMYLELNPDLVMLDLHMPGRDGLALLARIRAHAMSGPYLPIVVITGDVSREARRRTLDAGASDFLTKPYDVHEVLLRARNLLEMRFLHLALAEENRTLEERVLERTQALQASQLEVLERLAAAAELRDDNTGHHIRRVGGLAGFLAEAIGTDPGTVDLIRRAAPLHDIGKIGIPDGILLKPGPLTPAEFEVMKRHTTLGAAILAGGATDLVRMAERIALSHHERWNGGGYPDGLAGDAIPLEARLVSVADFIDALNSDRPYRPAVPLDEVLAMVAAGRGTQFDPAIVDAVFDHRVAEWMEQLKQTLEALPAITPAL